MAHVAKKDDAMMYAGEGKKKKGKKQKQNQTDTWEKEGL